MKELDVIIAKFSKVLRQEAKDRCDPYILQMGDNSKRYKEILEDLRNLGNQLVDADLLQIINEEENE